MRGISSAKAVCVVVFVFCACVPACLRRERCSNMLQSPVYADSRLHATTLIAATDTALCIFVVSRRAVSLASCCVSCCFSCWNMATTTFKFCHVAKDGDIQVLPLLVYFFSFVPWACVFVLLLWCWQAGYLHDVRQVAEDCMIQSVRQEVS